MQVSIKRNKESHFAVFNIYDIKESSIYLNERFNNNFTRYIGNYFNIGRYRMIPCIEITSELPMQKWGKLSHFENNY